MKIKSSDFENGGTIPDQFTQFDANRSPAIDFVDVPAAARTLVLIMDDRDAPHGLFTHWIVFNIDPNAGGFRKNEISDDVRLGKNSYEKAEYAGPKPPDGEHRYFFRLFALDQRLDLQTGTSRAEVERAMEGHVIAKAELMGRYATPVSARWMEDAILPQFAR
jgi:Raf kinase inhibitor-like YbhB/YbcL family protein